MTPLLRPLQTSLRHWMAARPQPPQIYCFSGPERVREQIPPEDLADPESALPLVWRQAQSIARVLPDSLRHCLLRQLVILQDGGEAGAQEHILGVRLMEDTSLEDSWCQDCAAIVPYTALALCCVAIESIESLCKNPRFDSRTLLEKPLSPLSILDQAFLRRSEFVLDLPELPALLNREAWIQKRLDEMMQSAVEKSEIEAEDPESESFSTALQESASSPDDGLNQFLEDMAAFVSEPSQGPDSTAIMQPTEKRHT